MRHDLSISALRAAFQEGRLTPSSLIEQLYPGLEQERDAFISIANLRDLQERCRHLESLPEAERQPLWGIPFAVKDNIDALPFPTTAACPAFEYTPTASAPAVLALIRAGGVLVGKTNMDQFAAGLVGTRTPYGTARNAFDDRFIPGGSSSGSAAIVGAGLISFALGTDTAGSGRVPAMLNGCVGIKPTVRRVSTTGVVPACRSLDCISCFARTVEDGALVVKLMQAAGSLSDPRWQPPPEQSHHRSHLANGNSTGSATHSATGGFRFGVPGPEFLAFEGPGGTATAHEYKKSFSAAVRNLEAGGGELIDVDFAPFSQVAHLLYNSAFVAERYEGIRSFLESSKGAAGIEDLHNDPRMERVTAAIVSAGTRYSAADAFSALSRLRELQAEARVQLEKVDILLVPTVLQNFLVAEIEAEEKPDKQQPVGWGKNALSGRFTNFVNLLDLAAVSVPSGLIRHPDLADTPCEGEVARRRDILAQTGNPRPNLPFGVTLIGPAWTDEFLWETAARLHRLSGLGCGPEGHGVKAYRRPRPEHTELS